MFQQAIQGDSHSRGFTIVEFIVVSLVIGVLASVTMSRLIRGSAMNGIVLRDQVISFTRTVQQSAMGRENVSLEIRPNLAGTTITLTSSSNGGEMETSTFSLQSISVSGDINETDSCSVTNGDTDLSNADYLVLNFTSLGDLADSGIAGSEAAITSAVRMCINEDPLLSVCLSPSGFAYAGDCDV
ncbi:MAG: prepilin-type N-terminal cleavage/methylation domain-containing protein [Pseudohongiellaceae bacterium]